MSEIANALAKAKERTGQTSAPFLVPGAAPVAIDPTRAAAAAAAIRKARRTQRFWIVLIVLTLPATAYLVWSRLRPETTPTLSLPATGLGDSSASAPGLSATEPTTSQSHSSPTHAGSSPAQSSDRPSPVQKPDFVTRVSALSVSAVMPGDPPRVVIGGRILRQGQALDDDLTFTGVANGQLLFTDSRGAVYTRRY